ncbi:hypothetical protein [Bacillus wiedmannii]|uniref:hypothetical protein n=1 Tax=Bacillus wiedmannii TaxID=1890302 RepID=UPI000BF053BC|nr:hypothetical protein [Bacillus wiedmannii]PEJ48438.1 hypothetical protein CN672_13935 [Bacillus wiedmannii]PEM10276.1 hypothetical protein CN610_13895 [Bacillus wiedmannii]PHD09540.1 hypothetical protein COF45_17755 [Bacillus wiedmannii]
MSRYDGLEVLENSKKYGGFMQLTNYGFMFMYRVANAGIVSMERMAVAMDMLTFKHGEERPHTSQDTFAKRFDCTVKSIKAAVKDLKTSRLINIFKKGRSNSYDLSPLLKCLASFIEHVHEGKEFCIKRLIEDVLSGVYVPKRIQEEEQEVEPEFDEVITTSLDKLSDEDRKAAIPIIKKYKENMSSKSVVFYIELAATKERFEGYFHTCMKDGTDDKVSNLKATKPKPKYKAQPKGRKEQVPDWLHKKDDEDDSLAEIKSYINLQVTEKGTELTDTILNDWINGEIGKHGNDIDRLVKYCEEQNRKFMEAITSQYKRKDA